MLKSLVCLSSVSLKVKQVLFTAELKFFLFIINQRYIYELFLVFFSMPRPQAVTPPLAPIFLFVLFIFHGPFGPVQALHDLGLQDPAIGCSRTVPFLFRHGTSNLIVPSL